MQKNDYVQLLRRYMDSWLAQDMEMFLSTLSNAVDIRECYGASYRSKGQAEKWFGDWNQLGRVLRWEIMDMYFDADRGVLVASWEFEYRYPGAEHPVFDGITVMKAQHGRITMLHEYESKHERYYPYR